MQADIANRAPGRLIPYRAFADALGITTRTLYTRGKTDPEFPLIVRNGKRRFFAEEDCEKYRQTLIRRSLGGRG
jgi:hypothetical protein